MALAVALCLLATSSRLAVNAQGQGQNQGQPQGRPPGGTNPNGGSPPSGVSPPPPGTGFQGTPSPGGNPEPRPKPEEGRPDEESEEEIFVSTTFTFAYDVEDKNLTEGSDDYGALAQQVKDSVSLFFLVFVLNTCFMKCFVVVVLFLGIYNCL